MKEIEMSAVAATPEERVVRAGLGNMFKRMWRRAKSFARSAWNWIVSSTKGAAAAALRAVGYVGRGASWLFVTGISGMDWLTAAVVVLVLAVLSGIALGATAIGAGLIWTLSKVIYFSHYWLYGFFRWMSVGRPTAFRVFRNAMIAKATAAPVTAHDALDEDPLAFTKLDPDDVFDHEEMDKMKPNLSPESVQPFEYPTPSLGTSDILDLYDGTREFAWDAFPQDEDMLAALAALSKIPDPGNQGYVVGRYKALAEYLQDPKSWDPDDARPLSLTLHQFKSQQSVIPAKQITAGYTDQVELLKSLLVGA